MIIYLQCTCNVHLFGSCLELLLDLLFISATGNIIGVPIGDDMGTSGFLTPDLHKLCRKLKIFTGICELVVFSTKAKENSLLKTTDGKRNGAFLKKVAMLSS